MVLAAGAGRRMRPLSKERPKSVLPTLDVPQLGWALARLATAGVPSAWVNAHDGANLVREAAESAGDRLEMRVMISHEAEAPLGTAGALARITGHLTETFVVMNADVLCDLSIQRLIDAHRSSGASATVAAIPTESEADFGIEEGWVLELVDRQDRLRSGHRYGGMAVFEPEAIAFVPPGASGLYETVFTRLIQEEKGIAAVEWEGYWRDIGSPAAHLGANLDALAQSFDDSGIPKLLGGAPYRRDAQAFVGAGAEIEEVEVRHVVIGSGAVIARGTRLERCVVWDGAYIERGEYRDAILTGSQVVPAA